MDEIGIAGSLARSDAQGIIMDGRLAVGFFRSDIENYLNSDVYSFFSPFGSFHLSVNPTLNRVEGIKLGSPSPSFGWATFYTNTNNDLSFDLIFDTKRDD